MFSSNAKRGYLIDFSSSKNWDEIATSSIELDSKYPDSDAGFYELIERLVSEKQLDQLTGGLSLGFKFGSREHRDFWEKEKEALINNLAPEYEELKSKVSAGVFRVAVKTKKEKPSIISSIITSFSRASTKSSHVVPSNIDIYSEIRLPKIRVKEVLSTMAVTSSESSKVGRNFKKKNSVIPSQI